jgi:hypothetical protein
MRTAFVVAVASVFLSWACARSNTPVAPTSPHVATTSDLSSSVGLTVRVVTRGAEQPIAGATVFENSDVVGRTDTGGEIQTNVPLGVEFHISVAATGFVTIGAFGTVRSQERWTFYLEHEP